MLLMLSITEVRQLHAMQAAVLSRCRPNNMLDTLATKSFRNGPIKNIIQLAESFMALETLSLKSWRNVGSVLFEGLCW